MSYDPSAGDDDSESLVHDEWPLDDYEAPDREPTYIGIMNPDEEQKSTALFYDNRNETIFQADVEEEEQRFVSRDDTERNLEPTDTLGEVLEDFGDRLEWDSLSSFGREQLQSDNGDTETDTTSPDSITFTQSNVSETAAHDLEFSGSYLYQHADQELTVERTFEITYDDPTTPHSAVAVVTDRLLETSDDAGTLDTDADKLEEHERTFEIDLDASDPERQLETRLEQACKDWHTAHADPTV
ncbi:hypothetical protein G6M89_01625 [Natronolimnobius sp. AArcel1]|uniref:hypothetical protein n=1 Tax=Natronolimnobius sp. AArcel1 TaxID=1679093 RepID=UPI0013EBE990|nr:hypothetical protein [Natronolimnobius sp. AArcel1]NGM67720.1 hypothetical protein [Natronolimnobius sp. AArcel1]